MSVPNLDAVMLEHMDGDGNVAPLEDFAGVGTPFYNVHPVLNNPDLSIYDTYPWPDLRPWYIRNREDR